MTNYPGANTAAAWYQDNYPGAVMDPNCGVIHTTEGYTLPGYEGGATAPTYTAVPDLKAKRLRWFAHFPDERSARALQNLAGGVETNTANAIQVELVGTCDPRTHKTWQAQGHAHVYWPEAPKWALDELAAFVAWCHTAHGIPVDGPKGPWTPYPESYGPGGQRFTFETPLMWLDKAETWELARTLGGQALVDLIVNDSHTCYHGVRDTLHAWGYGCGTCPACALRKAGFERWSGAATRP